MAQATIDTAPLDSAPLGAPAAPAAEGFIDRRREATPGAAPRERRQFTNSHEGLSAEAAELAQAIDSYKATHRRRFINYEEMLSVIQSLGYTR